MAQPLPQQPDWQSLYTCEPCDINEAATHTLDLFKQSLTANPDATLIHYFDQTLSYAQIDQLSTAFATTLRDAGFKASDRLALYMQNTPDFIIASIAAWKLGGTAVPFNPMLRSSELKKLSPDCAPFAIVAQMDLVEHVRTALSQIDLEPLVFVSNPYDFQSANDTRVLPDVSGFELQGEEQLFKGALAAAGEGFEQSPTDAPAFLVYTSGTTGMPKGVMITHHSICVSALVTTRWMHLSKDLGPVYVIAPMFHITGIVGGFITPMQFGGAMVLGYRFHTDVVLESFKQTRPSFTVGAITAYNALMSSPNSTKDHYSSFKSVMSGGAPVPPALSDAFFEHSGVRLHNAYGLTETSAGITITPRGLIGPTDPESGALSVGLPVSGTHIWISDDDGKPLPPGEVGEIIAQGSVVSPGYWNREEATAESMREDGFRTGDVGLMDENGWIFIIDRSKDMIIASGYKVWPREVEDVIYTHDAINEVAVVGVDDEYRGETVKAVVSLKAGKSLEKDQFIAWCRERMAAYKVPRFLKIMDDLPKTPTGKILRRELKDKK
jgi:long-chain acyl-CoA synthetase